MMFKKICRFFRFRRIILDGTIDRLYNDQTNWVRSNDCEMFIYRGRIDSYARGWPVIIIGTMFCRIHIPSASYRYWLFAGGHKIIDLLYFRKANYNQRLAEFIRNDPLTNLSIVQADKAP